MTIAYMATIHADDYPRIRSMLVEKLPDTFEEWNDLREQQAAKYVGAGLVVVHVDIDVDEFTRRHAPPDRNLAALDSFAAERARGGAH